MLTHYLLGKNERVKVACDFEGSQSNANPPPKVPHTRSTPENHVPQPIKFSLISLLRKTATMTARQRSTMETERRTKRTADASVTICDDGHRCENWSLCVEKEGDEGVSLGVHPVLVCFISIAQRAHPSRLILSPYAPLSRRAFIYMRIPLISSSLLPTIAYVCRTSSATAMLPRFPEFMRVSIVNTRPHTFAMERTAASRRLRSAPTEERVSETSSPNSSVIVPRATSAITASSFMEVCPLSGTRRQPLVPTRQVLPRRTGRVAELPRG